MLIIVKNSEFKFISLNLKNLYNKGQINLKRNTMKTTILVIVIFIVSFSEAIYSQEYQPLLNNSSWIAYKFNLGAVEPPQDKIIEEGVDIEIGSVIYKKFVDPFIISEADNKVYLREDVLQKKVFSLINGIETIIYDFSLENSDTFTQDEQTYVATVDFINVNGIIRKRIELQSIILYNGHDLRQTWIEGIGSTSHPLRPNYNAHSRFYSTHQFIYQKCSFQNGVHTYGDLNCSSLLNTTDENELNLKINFYPNPFVTELNIQNEKRFQDLTIKLYNSVGQMVREVNNLKGQKITLRRENLANGLYCVQLFEKGKLLKSGKLLITN